METRQFNISIIDDSLVEDNELFEVHLTGSSHVILTRSIINITITDNDGKFYDDLWGFKRTCMWCLVPQVRLVSGQNVSAIMEGTTFDLMLEFSGELDFAVMTLTITVVDVEGKFNVK